MYSESNGAILGVNLLRGTASAEDRLLIGPYARLGFGKWGILAEHDYYESHRQARRAGIVPTNHELWPTLLGGAGVAGSHR